MGLIKYFQQKDEREAQERADLNLDFGLKGTLPESQSEAYKKGFKTAYLMYNDFWSRTMPFAIITALTLMHANTMHNALESQAQRNQAKQERTINFYQKHGNIPEGVSPAYLDLRTQLWQAEVEKVEVDLFYFSINQISTPESFTLFE